RDLLSFPTRRSSDLRVFVNSIFQKSFESKLDIRLQIFPVRKVFVNMNIDFPVFSFFDIIFAFCCSFLFLRHYSPSSSMRTSEMYRSEERRVGKECRS